MNDAASLRAEVARRRTFAIISHPDAGKTTLTEKLLLYGGAVRLAGAVKARRARRHATSDWMEIERERGISVTSSVLQFGYRGLKINLLDTPGHQDFSEDTYRTLVAADSAVMVIDAAKGVEPQTEKLFHVCRQRGVPILTFVNKLDREGREPLDLLSELESVLGIRSLPLDWPMGRGSRFRGVYDRQARQALVFEGEAGGALAGHTRRLAFDSAELRELLGDADHRRLGEELELLDVAGERFDRDRIDRGELTPACFGSALTNAGVEPFLDSFIALAAPPGPRATTRGILAPDGSAFAGFVFKIQANMDPSHRDRMAFLRVCAGRFTRGMTARLARTGREIRLSKPHQFVARERELVDEAYPGDIVGLFDPGLFRIGDTLSTSADGAFTGLPHFAPEHFATIRPPNALKRKQLERGLEELAEEGAIQLFRRRDRGMKDPIVGAVGQLQFDVLQYRLASEYGAEVRLERLPYAAARWAVGPAVDADALERFGNVLCVLDRDERLIALFASDWAMRTTKRDHPTIDFRDTWS